MNLTGAFSLSRLNEQRFLLTGKRVIETAPLEEIFRRRDGHDFQNVVFFRACDAGIDQSASDASTLVAVSYTHLTLPTILLV